MNEILPELKGIHVYRKTIYGIARGKDDTWPVLMVGMGAKRDRKVFGW